MHMCNMTHAYFWHYSFTYVVRLGRKPGDLNLPMTDSICVTSLNSYMWHDPFIRVAYLLHIYGASRQETELFQSLASGITSSCMWNHSFYTRDTTHVMYATWLMYTCGMLHSYVWHDSSSHRAVSIFDTCHHSFICEAWIISCLWHDLFIRVVWAIHTCDMTHQETERSQTLAPSITPPYAWHESFDPCDMTQSNMCDMTHSYNVTWLIRKLSGHNHWLRSHGTYSYIRLKTPPLYPTPLRPHLSPPLLPTRPRHVLPSSSRN